MKKFRFLPVIVMTLLLVHPLDAQVKDHFKKVDQVIWVVADMDNVIHHWKNMGFKQIRDLDTVQVTLKKDGSIIPIKMAIANLGGAHVTWFQPLKDESLFSQFNSDYGDGAMSLVHRFTDIQDLNREVNRLAELGVGVLEEISILTNRGELVIVFMDTRKKGKYVLGYTYGEAGITLFEGLSEENLHRMKINQYAFAIRQAESVSSFWASLGQPPLQINHPELDNMHYYGEPTDHELIQGWQRHGTVAFEWCIPLKPPIVYEDHIVAHGEGIHHLAFTVKDMDKVIEDFTSKGYVNSMGGTWGEKGKSGSGRYEYIDLEEAGGVTMELLWNFK